MRYENGAQAGGAMNGRDEALAYLTSARSADEPLLSAQASGRMTTTRKKSRADLRFRLAYTKPELLMLLPFGHTTLEEMIKRGVFPDGLRPHPTAHKIWPRRVIEDWLEKPRGSER